MIVSVDSAKVFEGIVSFGYEVGQLKKLPRSGWLLAGVPRFESVAEHSFRVGVLAYVIAAQEGANPEHAAVLGLFHDLPECRIGDVPSVGKDYVQTADPRLVIADQVAGLPSTLAKHIESLVSEHEDAKKPDSTAESRCSRDADKLDLLLQAREYAAQGNQNMERYIDSMVRAVSTATGVALAQAALTVPTSAWWDGFAARFGLPKDSVQSA